MVYIETGHAERAGSTGVIQRIGVGGLLLRIRELRDGLPRSNSAARPSAAARADGEPSHGGVGGDDAVFDRSPGVNVRATRSGRRPRPRAHLTIDDVDTAVNSWTAQARLTPPATSTVSPYHLQIPSGVGTRRVEGRGVVALSPSDAFDRLEPGDIQVTAATTPAYNSILPIVGGSIVSAGGPSCHPRRSDDLA